MRSSERGRDGGWRRNGRQARRQAAVKSPASSRASPKQNKNANGGSAAVCVVGTGQARAVQVRQVITGAEKETSTGAAGSSRRYQSSQRSSVTNPENTKTRSGIGSSACNVVIRTVRQYAQQAKAAVASGVELNQQVENVHRRCGSICGSSRKKQVAKNRNSNAVSR